MLFWATDPAGRLLGRSASGNPPCAAVEPQSALAAAMHHKKEIEMRINVLIALLVVAAGFVGCTVGPNSVRPSVD